jgi:hypothetical protein
VLAVVVVVLVPQIEIVAAMVFLVVVAEAAVQAFLLEVVMV